MGELEHNLSFHSFYANFTNAFILKKHWYKTIIFLIIKLYVII